MLSLNIERALNYLRVLKFHINSAFLSLQMMNSFFREHNGKLKQAAKQKPLLRLCSMRKAGPALGSPLWLDLRKLLPWDLVPFWNPSVMLRGMQGCSRGTLAWAGAVQTPRYQGAGCHAGVSEVIHPRSAAGATAMGGPMSAICVV